MRKLPEVQQAKELMSEAMDWSTFKWIFEKGRVRETADQANASLERLERSVKARWSTEVKEAYKHLTGSAAKSPRTREKDQQPPQTVSPQIPLLLEKFLKAHQAAESSRKDAEETFDQAEKQLSTSLAREGCKKAIHSWELREKAIRKAEEVINALQAEPQVPTTDAPQEK